ncbi:hypothetical protein [Candidatus Merdisoma sp. JLR.KK006]|uniref:hypothetical protein n=1 Tax=Candidatus Merdisoma sp. JLR.KK006 TaxID=3112626 RepID=UPI002FF0E2C8
MLTLKLTPQFPTPHIQSCQLTLPAAITFHHLHAALDLILQLSHEAYYSFMLMTSRHAIEANTAEDYKAVSAFKQNPQIRYLNPYPGTFACLLELESIDDKESYTYPRIKGTNDDKQINNWLKEYCNFTKDWQYRNEEFFQRLYHTKQGTPENQSIKEQKTIHNSSTPCRQHLKTMEEKQQVWDSFWEMHEYDENIRVTVGASKYSQAELLEISKKDNLLNYCRYSSLPVAANWKKKQLSEAFCSNLKENTWLAMVLLPRTGLELYFRLCRLKENQKLSLSQEEAEALKVLLYLGMADLLLTKEETDIRLELPADFKKYFLKFFQDSRNFTSKSACASYLSHGQKAGSWQKIVKGYEKLDYRTSMLLCRYGILSVKDLYDKLCTCYSYTFSQTEFKVYLMLRLRLLEEVYTGHLLGSRERIAAPFGLDISYALREQEELIPASRQRPVAQKELDGYEEWMAEQTEGLMRLMSNFTEDIYLLGELTQEIVFAVLANYKWEDYLEVLEELLEELDDSGQVWFWYELSKLYLHLPVAGLGGYSRIEYAKKEQLDNPYLVLNDKEDFTEPRNAEEIFGLPFEIQWQLFSYGERFAEDGSDLSERRLLKYARKHLNKEMVSGLQMYCYMISGNPKLLGLLEKMSEQGDARAQEMLGELDEMLSGMIEEWEPYE